MSWDNCNATASPPIEAPPVMDLVQWTGDGKHWFGNRYRYSAWRLQRLGSYEAYNAWLEQITVQMMRK